MKALLFKLLKCNSCQGNMKRCVEKGTVKYICHSYTQGLCSTRYIIKEDILKEFIQQYCRLKRIEYIESYEFMKSIIKQIIIDKDESFEIHYLDNTIANKKSNGSFNYI